MYPERSVCKVNKTPGISTFTVVALRTFVSCILQGAAVISFPESANSRYGDAELWVSEWGQHIFHNFNALIIYSKQSSLIFACQPAFMKGEEFIHYQFAVIDNV